MQTVLNYSTWTPAAGSLLWPSEGKWNELSLWVYCVFNNLRQNGGIQDIYNNIFDGSDYLEAVQAEKIKDDNIVLMTSIDGAQLYWNKQSDC